MIQMADPRSYRPPLGVLSTTQPELNVASTGVSAFSSSITAPFPTPWNLFVIPLAGDPSTPKQKAVSGRQRRESQPLQLPSGANDAVVAANPRTAPRRSPLRGQSRRPGAVDHFFVLLRGISFLASASVASVGGHMGVKLGAPLHLG